MCPCRHSRKPCTASNCRNSSFIACRPGTGWYQAAILSQPSYRTSFRRSHSRATAQQPLREGRGPPEFPPGRGVRQPSGALGPGIREVTAATPPLTTSHHLTPPLTTPHRPPSGPSPVRRRPANGPFPRRRTLAPRRAGMTSRAPARNAESLADQPVRGYDGGGGSGLRRSPVRRVKAQPTGQSAIQQIRQSAPQPWGRRPLRFGRTRIDCRS